VIDIVRSPLSLLPRGEGSGMREAMAATFSQRENGVRPHFVFDVQFTS
jgi:hypothetical protein